MRVLVVRVTSMGDVVLTLPAITDMIENVPGIEIDWLVERPFAAIATMHPSVKTVHPVAWRKWRKTLWKSDTRQAMRDFRHKLRDKHYDVILDFQGQIAKSVVLGAMAKGPMHGFAAQGLREPLSAMFYKRKAEVSKNLHLVPRSRAMAAKLLGYAVPTSAPRYGMKVGEAFWHPNVSGDAAHAVTQTAAPTATQADPASQARYAILIPHASRPEKHWPEERWVAVGERLRREGLEVVVFWGSPAEEKMATSLATHFGGQVPPFLTVAQAATVLAHAEIVVGLDTGFTHLAAGLERPTVGIYCDFDPKLAGVMGPAYCASLGGVGQVPALEDVQKSVGEALAAVTRTVA